MSARFPVPPGVVVRVVQAAADPDTDVSDLSRLLETDAVLSAQVLRCVNSACFGLRHRVASVEHAVAIMGMRAVRNLALSMGVRGLVPTTEIGEFPLEVFWEASLRRGAAAQCLAELMELSQVEEFFTLGLCQDIGVLIGLMEDDTLATALGPALREPAETRLGIERERGDGHPGTAHAMFSEWNFPEELLVPLLNHHDPDSAPEPHRRRARVAHAADAIADLAIIEDKATAMRIAVDSLQALGLPQTALARTVDRVNELVEEFAQLLGVQLDEQLGSEQIAAMAAEGLAEINLSYEEVTRRLEQSLDEQRQMASELQRLNQELDRQAHIDTLTGLANRRFFDKALIRELAIAERHGSQISLLTLDVDHFKRLNDTYGHPAGDRVLRSIGALFIEQARLTDVAARYGGEEFAIILPFTDRAGGEIAAERIRRSLEGLNIPGDLDLRVTVSIGGATLENVVLATTEVAAELVSRADRALYEAKRGGRNRYCWSEESPTVPRLAPAIPGSSHPDP